MKYNCSFVCHAELCQGPNPNFVINDGTIATIASETTAGYVIFDSELTKNPVPGFSAGLLNDSLYTWEIMVIGPKGTP
jgi:hypothetical protein